MTSNEKEIIGIKIGSFTTSIGKSSKKNKIMTFDLILFDNTNYRQIPSLYTFESTTNQYIGIEANAHIKRSLNYSFENISRLISIDINSDFGKKELEYVKYAIWDPKMEKFEVPSQEHTGHRLPSEIVSSYIGLLQKSYLPDLGKNEEVYINIPDYLTYIQKKKYFQLLNQCHINGYLIPESVAYTIYYGYTKSGDLFTSSPIRFVLLVDVGHSKTTYILAKYEEKKYQIMDFEQYQFGGRDVDNLLYKYFLNSIKYKEINIKKDKLLKFKLKLYDQIKEIKQMMAVNNELDIGIDKLDGEDKLNIQITRNKFENATKDILDEINLTFNKFLDKCYKKVGSNLIIEILSDLNKLPYLKNNMENNKYKIKVSQTVQHDESVAIGCCLYGSFKNNLFPQNNFEGILGYNTTNIYYSINSSEQKIIFLQKGEPIPINKIITVNLKKDLNDGKIKIKLFYSLDDIKFYLKENNILEFDFSPNEEIIKNAEIVDIHISVEINGIIECKNISYTKNYFINKNKRKSMITYIENEMKYDKNQENDVYNPYDREEISDYPKSKTKKILDGEELIQQRNDVIYNTQILSKENNIPGKPINQNQTTEKFKEEKKELEELLKNFNANIKEKKFEERRFNNMDHFQFMEDFKEKIKTISNEKDIITLKNVLSLRILEFTKNFQNDVHKLDKSIKEYIKYYKNILCEYQNNKKRLTSGQISNFLEKKEKLEKLEYKLQICIDKTDFSQIYEDYKSIIKK